MGAGVLKGLLLGLATGLYCLGTCAPALLPYLVSSGKRPGGTPRALGEFLAGRLVAYVLIGSLAATLGRQAVELPVGKKVAAALMVVLAALLVLHALTTSFPEARSCAVVQRTGVLSRFPAAAGFVLGMNACPPLLLAATYVTTLGGWLAGALAGAAFFVGTAVFLMPLALSGRLARVPALRGAAEAGALFAGLWFLAQGVALWMRS